MAILLSMFFLLSIENRVSSCSFVLIGVGDGRLGVLRIIGKYKTEHLR